MIDLKELKDVLKDHLSIVVSTESMPSYYDDTAGVSITVKLMFDEECIASDYSCHST